MASTAVDRPFLEERIVFACWAFVWPAYFVGALYLIGPVLGVALTAIWAIRMYFAPAIEPALRPNPIPFSVWVWIAAMALMFVALFMGHILNHLGMGALIKSTIGWAKGWALMAMFPLVGACLHIQSQTLYRASNWLALQTLILTPIFFIAPLAGLPERLYVSPLRILGGAGAEYFAVHLYIVDPGQGFRWGFMAPWAPAAGFVACIMLICGLEDRSRFWRIVGVAGAVTIVMLSKSRMALLCMMLAWPTALMISRAFKPSTHFLGMVGFLAVGLLADRVMAFLEQTIDRMTGARADSSRVRGALNRMAFERWKETPWWGNGVVETGPHYVEFMPIGSHHTWLGILFVKGAVAGVGFVFAMVWSTLDLIVSCSQTKTGRAGLASLFVMWFFSMSENLEMLAYLYWPGLVLMGIAFREAAELSKRPREAAVQAA